MEYITVSPVCQTAGTAAKQRKKTAVAKAPSLAATVFLFRSELFLHGFQALLTNVFSFEVDHIFTAVAKNAAWPVLSQYDGRALDIDLQRITLRNVQSAAQLDGQDNPSQLIYLPYDPS
jgi:hypothetical protein